MARMLRNKYLFLVFFMSIILCSYLGWHLIKHLNSNYSYCGVMHVEEVVESDSNELEDTNPSPNSAYLINTPGCKIQSFDPFDATVSGFVATQAPVICPGKPLFLQVQTNGSLTLNHTVLSNFYDLDSKTLSCFYRSIRRKYEKPGNVRENDYTIGNKVKLEFGKPLEEDHVVVDCNLGKENLTQYIPIPRLKKEVEDKKKTAIPVLNVIVLGVDSISKLNFLRHFRKTNVFFKEKLFPFEMKGYTKVGDNSFPNILPLLGGRFPWDIWNESVKDTMFFDDVDLIWKHYSKKGYRTFFTEDMSHYGTFNYGRRGFHDQPTDYYYRPLALAIYQSELLKKSKKYYCLNSQTETDIIYDYLINFIKTMDHRPYFAFAMTSSLTHDYLNQAAYADEPVFRLLDRLWNSGALNSTALVFFSDHGIRFGGIRYTYIGKIEERMPFMYMYLPQWFLNHYPHFSESLRKNQERLVTLFDVHATMLHLLEPHKESHEMKYKALSPYGSSLLNEISKYRTCEKASILAPWCVCLGLHPESVHDPSVVAAASAIIHYINLQLRPYRTLCLPLEINSIESARYGQLSDLVLRFTKHENVVNNRYVEYGQRVETFIDYMVKVATKPNDGVYEGTVRRNTVTNRYNVLHIKVLHSFADHSECLAGTDVRSFCYCIKRTDTT